MNLKENESIPEKTEYKLRFNPSYTPSTAKIKARSETLSILSAVKYFLWHLCSELFVPGLSFYNSIWKKGVQKKENSEPFQTSKK